MKLGIVSTIRRWQAEMNSWVYYHRSIGFDRLFVFCDELPSESIPSSAGLSVVICDAAHWQRTSRHILSEALDAEHTFSTPEWRNPHYLMIRQTINADLALRRALDEGVSWLLHIDSDELFYSPHVAPKEHFIILDQLNVDHARYLNLEAVASGGDHVDFLSHMDCFKMNRKLLTPHNRRWFLVHLIAGRIFFPTVTARPRSGSPRTRFRPASTVSTEGA